MLPLLFLVPAVLATFSERIVDNHVVRIEDATLTDVRPTETSTLTLDLSGLGIRNLKRGVFDHLDTLKILNLANNSLSSVPKRSFSRLGSLEHLNLASNNLSDFGKVFTGLNRLRTLNISYNPVPELGEFELHGLPNSSIVFTKGLNLSRIYANVFDKPAGPDYDHEEANNEEDKNASREERNVNDDDDYKDDYEVPEPHVLHLKLCIDDNNVLSLIETMKRDEIPPSGCCDFTNPDGVYHLNLSKLGVRGFQKSWCRLNDTTFGILNLAENAITEVTPDTLNEIPFQGFNLAFNRIERLDRGAIDNKAMVLLNLSSNAITEIQEGALSNTSLFDLFLSNNRLEDTKFVASLPSSLLRMDLGFNRITSIAPDSFLRLEKLKFLSFNGNLIQRLDADAFRGLTSLQEVSLSNNRISVIESGCFQRTPFLHFLYLPRNNISRFEKGVFGDKSLIRHLDARQNRLVGVKESFPDGLPSELEVLKLDGNRIETLERGDFSRVPKRLLSLTGNEISKIEPGAFDLHSLAQLELNDNKLGQLDAEAFRGLSHVQALSLNGNGIMDVPRGFTRYLRMLMVLKLDFNPIRRLRNGALAGLHVGHVHYVTLNGVPVEVVEAGVFEDM